MTLLPDPIAALSRYGGALALLIGTGGGFARTPGAMMAVLPDGRRVGAIGAGCVDADIAAHVDHVGPVARLVYGQGGPVDLPLPCGGRIEVLLIRRPDPVWLAQVLADRVARRMGRWFIDLEIGRIAMQGNGFALQLPPPCAFAIHGAGDEAVALASLVRALDLPLQTGPADEWTAVVTLGHDHDRDLPALRAALTSPAFYVGAMGSRRADAVRRAALADLDADVLARLRGPVGVVAPARDPRLLAASVLTEVLATYAARFG